MSFDNTFANPAGRTSRGAYIVGMVVLLAAFAFYWFLVKAGRNGDWVLFTFLFPAAMLHARRLHDMGQTAWLLLLPVGLTAAAFWLHMYQPGGSLQTPLDYAALGVSALFVLWALVGASKGA